MMGQIRGEIFTGGGGVHPGSGRGGGSFPSNVQFCVDFVRPDMYLDAYYKITRHCKELQFAPFPSI